ncbi:MAG: glycosyltransferase [Bacteroidetes bacterium]|nr:MAG: glycosyltransferase [Bacteroidota bacterium]
MLGWEYPPFLNGGLGVACAGLAAALSAHTRLTMVVPRTPEDHQPEGWELVGLEGKPLPALWESYPETVLEKLSKVHLRYLPVTLSGYERNPREPQVVEETQWYTIERQVHKNRLRRASRPFQLGALYGDDLWERVQEYTELVVQMVTPGQYDLIHAHDWMTFQAGLELKARFGLPLVLHVHSLEYDRGGPGSRGAVFQLERHALREADLILPVSQYTAEVIRDVYGVSLDKVRPVRNGIELAPAYRRPRPFPERLVVYLGRLTGQKGPAYFFEAARALLEQGAPVRFAIAGKGHMVEQLVEQAAEARLGHRIHFTGYLEPEAVRDLLAMADVYVMPSVSEPFGLSALEAAQMGVPCVLSRQSGVAEVLPGAEYVDYWDVPTMAQTIQALLEDETRREAVIRAQQQSLPHLGWEGAARQVVDAYQTLLT